MYRVIEKHIEQSLSETRFSKRRDRGVVHPLRIGGDGRPSYDPADWELEFRKVYETLRMRVTIPFVRIGD